MAVQDIGSNIAKIRKQKGYSQAKLAEVLNVSPQAVSKWETGVSGIVNNRAVEKYPKLHAAIPPVSSVRIFAGGSPCGLKLFTRMVL